MLQLVDYGSESDEENDEQAPESSMPLTNGKIQQKQPIKADSSSDEDEPDDSELASTLHNIPHTSTVQMPKIMHDLELEDLLGSRKEWERTLKTGGKISITGATSAAKKPSKRISAFGGLSLFREDPNKLEDLTLEEQKTVNEQNSVPLPLSADAPKDGLLSVLPRPVPVVADKKPSKTSNSSFFKAPTPVHIKNDEPRWPEPPRPGPAVAQKRHLEEDESDDDDDASDLMGIHMKMPKISVPISDSVPTAIFYDDVAPGPAKPGPSFEPSIGAVGEAIQGPMKRITDQAATDLIYQKELQAYGISSVAASDVVGGMIDVSVDQALGPDIQQTLMKNLNNKMMAQIAQGPLPKVKHDPKNRLAKQKHQITHLATLAVSREEQLQEKWAESRSKKKMSSQKYGF